MEDGDEFNFLPPEKDNIPAIVPTAAAKSLVQQEPTKKAGTAVIKFKVASSSGLSTGSVPKWIASPHKTPPTQRPDPPTETPKTNIVTLDAGDIVWRKGKRLQLPYKQYQSA